MSFSGDAKAQPPRVFFVNLRSGEGQEMPYTPTEFTETIIVNWTRQAVTGLSHEVLQYGNTASYQIPGLEFFISGIPQQPARGDFRGPTDTDAADRAEELRKFLMSLCYASESAQTVRDGAPPRILFCWPEMISLTCIIDQLSIRHEKFNRNGRSVIMRATMTLDEIRDVRLTSEQVRIQGTRRPSAQAIPFVRGANGATS